MKKMKAEEARVKKEQIKANINKIDVERLMREDA